jgi:hypothetical protein
MIEYNMALASASSNTKPVGMCTPPYLLPSWTLLKPSLCLYRQVACDINSCGVNIRTCSTVEDPLVHKGSSICMQIHIAVALLSDCIYELDVFPHGREWLALLVATHYNNRMLNLSNLFRVPTYKLNNNVNRPIPGVLCWTDAGCGELTQLTMEVI